MDRVDVYSTEFWEEVWERSRQDSYLKQTQANHPERWQSFYDEVAHLWEPMSGRPGQNGRQLARFLLDKGLVGPNKTALDIGCGPGALALALANEGVSVTALDSSAGMIQTLREQANAGHLQNLTPMRADWLRYSAAPGFDLVSACFFPPALKPRGLRRLEALSRGNCLLLLGDGKETFPLRKRIWEQVMGRESQKGSFYLACAFNYLLAAGRAPCLEHLAWPAELDLPQDQVRLYFEKYFGIFGKQGAELDRAISQALEPHVSQGRVRLSGTYSLAALWWHLPGAERKTGEKDYAQTDRRPDEAGLGQALDPRLVLKASTATVASVEAAR